MTMPTSAPSRNSPWRRVSQLQLPDAKVLKLDPRTESESASRSKNRQAGDGDCPLDSATPK
jgi:hypothetical protein